MKRIFITGSTDGLGLACARRLISEGHAVLLHARSHARAMDLDSVVDRSAGVVVGDLSSANETHALADQVNARGRFDVVIHNAGIASTANRAPTPENQASLMAVNVIAPYLLTARINRPDRLIYLTSDMIQGGFDTLADFDWQQRPWNGTQAYSESKLYVATLALAVANRWSNVISHAVDPGWVATRMGGSQAPGSIDDGQATQSWLAVSSAVQATTSGGFWRRKTLCEPPDMARNQEFQNRLIDHLCAVAGGPM